MRIPRELVDELKARCDPGEECAALLFGVGDSVKAWRWMRNVAESPIVFKLDPEEVYAALKTAEEAGLELIALFHTHPGAPVPSPVDVKYMKMWRVVWVIANVYTAELRAWRLAGNRLEEVDIEVF